MREVDRKLFNAAKQGDLSKVQEYLKEGADIDAKDDDGETPLRLTVKGNHWKAAVVLLMNSANVDDLNRNQKQDLLNNIDYKYHGSDHFQVATLLTSLGNAYGALGDPNKQKELLERALKIQEKHYGPERFEVVITLVTLGNAYGALGDPKKKKELLERALKIQEKHYGPEYFEVAITLVNLGNAYGALGDPKKKKELLERALKIKEKHYGPEHFEVAITLVNLGNAYGALGDPNKQKELLERTLKIQEKHYGPEHFEVAITLVNLGNAYGALGDPNKQKELQERALKIQEKHYRSEHFEVSRTLGNLGNAYGNLGDPKKKKELLERALKIEEKHYGPEHFEVAITLVNLGNAYGALGDPNKQKELLERALKIEEKHYGPEHFEVAITLVNLGNAYGALDDPNKQKELLERALPILERHNHPIVTTLKVTLEKLGGITPLHLAAQNGCLGVVNALIKYVKENNLGGLRDFINAKTENNRTPLYFASKGNHPEVVKALLEKGANFEARCFGHTPLYYAKKDVQSILRSISGLFDNLKSGRLQKVIDDIKNGTIVGATDDKGFTLLHHAAAKGHKEIVKLLLDHKADLNVKDKDGSTPLDLAKKELIQDPENDDLKKIVDVLNQQIQSPSTSQSGGQSPETTGRTDDNPETRLSGVTVRNQQRSPGHH